MIELLQDTSSNLHFIASINSFNLLFIRYIFSIVLELNGNSPLSRNDCVPLLYCNLLVIYIIEMAFKVSYRIPRRKVSLNWDQ